MKTLKIATRGSRLALWQANWVKDQLLAQFPELQVELLPIKTKGDIILEHPLSKIGGKGLFVKELEHALLDGSADFAVHSMKDVPAILPEGLEISTITKREDPSDALVAPNFESLDQLPAEAIVGTSSLRRSSQIKHQRPDLQIKNLRGNVQTRLSKVHGGEYDAIILATSGLKRMELESEITTKFSFDVMLPAIAQGAIGIESRIGDEDVLQYLKVLHHEETAICVEAERAALRTLEGNCQVPIAGYAELKQGSLHLELLVSDPDGREPIRMTQQAAPGEADALGQSLAQKILGAGGDALLALLKEAASADPSL